MEEGDSAGALCLVDELDRDGEGDLLSSQWVIRVPPIGWCSVRRRFIPLWEYYARVISISFWSF